MIKDMDRSPGTGGRVVAFAGGIAYVWPIDGPVHHAIVCYTNGVITSLFIALDVNAPFVPIGPS